MTALYIVLGVLGALLLSAVITRLVGNFNNDHPEMQKDEVFVGNTDAEDHHHYGWNTKRYGERAYTIHGKYISKTIWPGAFPVFVKKSEMIRAGFRISQIRLLRIQVIDGSKVDIKRMLSLHPD